MDAKCERECLHWCTEAIDDRINPDDCQCRVKEVGEHHRTGRECLHPEEKELKCPHGDDGANCSLCRIAALEAELEEAATVRRFEQPAECGCCPVITANGTLIDDRSRYRRAVAAAERERDEALEQVEHWKQEANHQEENTYARDQREEALKEQLDAAEARAKRFEDAWNTDAALRQATERSMMQIAEQRDDAEARVDAWYECVAKIAQSAGCLQSSFPDGNGHVVEAIARFRRESAEAVATAVRNFAEWVKAQYPVQQYVRFETDGTPSDDSIVDVANIYLEVRGGGRAALASAAPAPATTESVGWTGPLLPEMANNRVAPSEYSSSIPAPAPARKEEEEEEEE
jgi:hypothetical protein